MSQPAEHPYPTIPTRPFRIDIPLHELLQTSSTQASRPADRELRSLPEPVFPQYPHMHHDLTAAESVA